MTLDAARQYLASPHLEPELRLDMETLLRAAEGGDAASMEELTDRFSEPLAFGTGGMRGVMAAGLKRMNKPNVRRTTMALAEVAQRRAPGRSVALVGFDTRIHSGVFAREAARVLASRGYTVFLGNRPLPTPFLCFAMRRLRAACGVIITASHNPKAYNGYKAYDDRGAQVVAPWDAEIEAAMNAEDWVPPAPAAEQDAFVFPIPADIEEAYLRMGLAMLANPPQFEAPKLLFTPFHGTGSAFVPELFQRAKMPLEVCEAQSVQDGTFPTAPRPNPEEIAAYAVPLEDARRLDCDAILANDPDADRIGVVAKRRGTEWELMSGNDLAALTLDYLCRFKQVKGVCITTVVTSDFLAEVARHHGLSVMWTLTGFKNIATCMDRLVEVGEAYAFGAEESFGMLLSPELRDKDGVIAALVVGEMIGHYQALSLGPFEAVDALQARIGTFHNRLVNLEDPRPGGAQRFSEAMTRIRENFSASDDTGALPLLGGERVVSWEDFQSGEWHGGLGEGGGHMETLLDRPDRRSLAQPIPNSNVLKFRLESGAFAAFRPSGTEPKLKVYLQSRTDTALLDTLEAQARAMLGLEG